ncbi:hypothetical protein IJH72_01835 [Candidatus Saccharibacteria bacterium]|nr:hypothetical protein [Candidatus Saccharibacteria bacterium]MBR0372662.1 hypothetical protein [Candidatus Saccharibacteria bacterium]
MSDYEAYKMLNSMSGSSYPSSYGTGMAEGAGIWAIIALILAIVGGILVYFLFANSKNEPKGKFAKWLKDFLNFKIMWIEGILKVVYYFATIFIILFSFTFLAMGGTGVLMFFFTLILGPVLIRIFYEATMMFIMIWRNTKDIAANTEKK